MVNNPICRHCGIELNDANWQPSRRKGNQHICMGCAHKRDKQWQKTNLDKTRAKTLRYARNNGVQPFNKNKECSLFLGVHVAERVLSKVFKDVVRMPTNNPGYDIICNHNKKIDIKSACLTKTKFPHWVFHIERNTIADLFLCLAFDNREDLNPMYVWLLPGNKFNHLVGTGISPSTTSRWDEYVISLDNVVACCDAIKESKQ